jgi:protein-serine/threonine kinase
MRIFTQADVNRITTGNWGSVWGAKPRKADYHPALRHTTLGLPPISQAIAAQHISDKIAVKLVYRKKDPTTAARVRALWSEMKVIRTLRDDPHPSIIGFDSFIITPSYAL